MKLVKRILKWEALSKIMTILVGIVILISLALVVPDFVEKYFGVELLTSDFSEKPAVQGQIVYPVAMETETPVAVNSTPEPNSTEEPPQQNGPNLNLENSLAIWVEGIASWVGLDREDGGIHPGLIDKIGTLDPGQWARQLQGQGVESFASMLEAMMRTNDSNEEARNQAWADVLAQAKALLSVNPQAAQVLYDHEKKEISSKKGDDLVSFLEKVKSKAGSLPLERQKAQVQGGQSDTGYQEGTLDVGYPDTDDTGSSSGSSNGRERPLSTLEPVFDPVDEAAKLATQTVAQNQQGQAVNPRDEEDYTPYPEEYQWFARFGDQLFWPPTAEMEIISELWNYTYLNEIQRADCFASILRHIQSQQVAQTPDGRPIYKMEGYMLPLRYCVEKYRPTPVPTATKKSTSNSSGNSTAKRPAPVSTPTPKPQRIKGQYWVGGELYTYEGMHGHILEYLKKYPHLTGSQIAAVGQQTLSDCDGNNPANPIKPILVGRFLYSNCSSWKSIIDKMVATYYPPP